MFPLANSLRTTTTRSLTAATSSTQRLFSNTAIAMGVTKTISKEGSGPSPKVGDKVTMDYTGYLKDTSKPDNKGKQCALLPPVTWAQTDIRPSRFDSSIGRGPFECAIGVGQVIKGTVPKTAHFCLPRCVQQAIDWNLTYRLG
jgi:FK506-binding protein 1